MNLPGCQGATRGSFQPATPSTAGYFTPGWTCCTPSISNSALASTGSATVPNSGVLTGPFGDGAADEDSAGAGARAGQLAGAGVAVAGQVFRAGDEVLPGVRLGGLVAGLVPGFALLAAAARVAIAEHDAVQR